MKYNNLLASILSAICLVASSAAWAKPVSPPPGWDTGKDKLSMGTITNGSESLEPSFASRPVYSLFTYAGIDGGGDPGTLIPHDRKVELVMDQLHRVEEATGKTMMPTIVFYTVNGSSSTTTLEADVFNLDFLTKHLQNLISIVQQLKSYHDARHPVGATLLLNPDFLGELQKQCGQYYCPIPWDSPIQVKEALTVALNAIHYDLSKVPPELLEDKQSFPGYVRAVNWIVREFGAPDVTFGWQVNVWAGDQSGHLWLHKATSQPKLIDQHATDLVKFIQLLDVYPQDEEHQRYRPDFIAFDKFERDDFTCAADDGCGTFTNQGYLYNGQDMNVYLTLIKEVSEQLKNIPVMLWQIPGGHTQVDGQEEIDPRNDHASVESSYLLGDPLVDDSLSNLKEYYAGLPLPSELYNTEETTVRGYLTLCPGSDAHCLQHNHLDQMKDAGVFAILWGGGSTTAVVGLSGDLDDNGWLYSRIKALAGSD